MEPQDRPAEAPSLPAADRRARFRPTIFWWMYVIAILAVILGILANTHRWVQERSVAQDRAVAEWVAWSGHISGWILNNTMRVDRGGPLLAKLTTSRQRFGPDEGDSMVWTLTTPQGHEIAATFAFEGGRLVRVALASAGREVAVPPRVVAAEGPIDLPALLPEAFR